MMELKEDVKEVVNIELLGQQYQLKCPADKVNSLLVAADKLHRQLLTFREDFDILSNERLFMLAALHFAYQQQSHSHENSDKLQQVNGRLTQLQKKLQQVLASDLELAL